MSLLAHWYGRDIFSQIICLFTSPFFISFIHEDFKMPGVIGSDIPGKLILDAVQRAESSLYSAGVNVPCHNRRGQPYTISQLPRSGSHPHTRPQSRVLLPVNHDTRGEELRSKNLFKDRSTTHNIHIFFPSPTFLLLLGHDHKCWSSSCSFFLLLFNRIIKS